MSLHLTPAEWAPITAAGSGVLFGAGDLEAGCLARWPEAASGEYHPNCCRFPKSCSVRKVPPAEFVEAAQACETCGGRTWRLHSVCCGFDDGYTYRATWQEVEDIRLSYLNGMDGHADRSAIIERCPHCLGGKRRIAAVVPCEHAGAPFCIHKDGTVTVGHVVVTWGPLVVVEKPPPSRSHIGSSDKSVFVHGGDLWFSSMQPHTTSPFITSLPPDIDPQSLVGQYAIGVEVAP